MPAGHFKRKNGMKMDFIMKTSNQGGEYQKHEKWEGGWVQ